MSTTMTETIPDNVMKTTTPSPDTKSDVIVRTALSRSLARGRGSMGQALSKDQRKPADGTTTTANRKRRGRRKSVQRNRWNPKYLRRWWGPIHMELVDCGDTFFELMLEIADDSDECHGFWCNRGFLADAFRENRMYSLCVEETDELYHSDRLSSENKIFVRPSPPWQLPCVCVIASDNPNAVEIIWVHPRARRLGLATELVRRLGIRTARQILPDSAPFWRAIQIPEEQREVKGE